MVREDHWSQSLMIRLWLCFVNGCGGKKSRRTHTREAHLVLHGGFSWLFKMALQEMWAMYVGGGCSCGLQGAHAVLADSVQWWAGLLIDFSCAILPGNLVERARWGWCNSTLRSRNYGSTCIYCIVLFFFFFWVVLKKYHLLHTGFFNLVIYF